MHNKKKSFLDTIPNKCCLGALLILALGAAVYIFAARYGVLEHIVELSKQHENWEIDEIITVSCFLVFAFAFFSFRQWCRVRISEKALLLKNQELEKALSDIKQLSGIVPICASCKKIRNDSGYWQKIEVYIKEHTQAKLSHGICPGCEKKLYPEFIENENKSEDKSSQLLS